MSARLAQGERGAASQCAPAKSRLVHGRALAFNGGRSGARKGLIVHEMTVILLDGLGGAQTIAPQNVASEVPEDSTLWVHVRQSAGEDGAWLTALGGDDIVASALMAEETRPRCTLYQGGVLMNLRGVNLNPGEDPEDMISLRIWAGPRRS